MSKTKLIAFACLCFAVAGCMDLSQRVAPEITGAGSSEDYFPTANCAGDVNVDACAKIWWALYEMANHGDAGGICRDIAMDIEAWTWFTGSTPPPGKDMGSVFTASGSDTTYSGEIVVGSGNLEQFSTSQIVGLLAHEHGHAVGQFTTEGTPNSQQGYCQNNVS